MPSTMSASINVQLSVLEMTHAFMHYVTAHMDSGNPKDKGRDAGSKPATGGWLSNAVMTLPCSTE